MAKYTEVIVDVKQGLPNYSSRRVSVTTVAEEGESLDVVREIVEVTRLIRNAWDMSSGKVFPTGAVGICVGKNAGSGKAIRTVKKRTPKADEQLKASDVMRAEADDDDDADLDL